MRAEQKRKQKDKNRADRKRENLKGIEMGGMDAT